MKQWSNTQNVIALSSGEAEYYSMVKGGSVGIGARNVLNDMGIENNIIINTDASAATGIASRNGLGKQRRIEVNQLWLQDKVGKGEIEARKISGGSNIADALAKHVEADKISRHNTSINIQVRNDRRSLMLK